jgi:hypothetical protein
VWPADASSRQQLQSNLRTLRITIRADHWQLSCLLQPQHCLKPHHRCIGITHMAPCADMHPPTRLFVCSCCRFPSCVLAISVHLSLAQRGHLMSNGVENGELCVLSRTLLISIMQQCRVYKSVARSVLELCLLPCILRYVLDHVSLRAATTSEGNLTTGSQGAGTTAGGGAAPLPRTPATVTSAAAPDALGPRGLVIPLQEISEASPHFCLTAICDAAGFYCGGQEMSSCAW